MLSNLETERGKLVQVFWSGNRNSGIDSPPPRCGNLTQRIAVRFHIQSLTRRNVQYIHHRLSVAGAANAVTFSRRALTLIYRTAPASHAASICSAIAC